MCGIVGFFDPSQRDLPPHITRMMECLRHRGPDDEGFWIGADGRLAFGYRRLSIVELSLLGRQPMTSASGRFVIIFNGEIYNFRDLREELVSKGRSFKGTSDTEVMLACFEEYGVPQALLRFEGMFAFAVWDEVTRELTLARDRLGEKPLYYGFQNGSFWFASELKALRAHPAFVPDLNRSAVPLFLRHNYIPAPYSIYRGISKLLPGAFITLSLEQLRSLSERSAGQRNVEVPSAIKYWDIKKTVLQRGKPLVLSREEALSGLEMELRRAVRQQMIADVPLGAFLSGGIDSSMIVAIMQSESRLPVRTFSIGFQEKEFNEAPYAKKVAGHLRTSHTEIYVSADDALSVIPKLPHIYDEPFSDSSQIPTFLLAQIAKQHVTVSLSGDGGDEIFGGYSRFIWADNLWRTLKRLPPFIRKVGKRGIMSLSVAQWDGLYRMLRSFLPKSFSFHMVGEKAYKLAGLLESNSREDFYFELLSHWSRPEEVVLDAAEPETLLSNVSEWSTGLEFFEEMQLMDILSYLPDDILVKVDRSSMAVSLETRAPFLDHHLVEYMFSLPVSFKYQHGEPKWLLKQLLYRFVPQEIVDRPKMGFSVPLGEWLRGELKDWAEALLDESKLAREGIFRPKIIRDKWLQHQRGERNWEYYLWDILMFQAWHDESRKGS